MYIRYKIYNESKDNVREEIAKFAGMYHNQEEKICYISFDGDFDDLLICIDEEEYKALLNDIDYTLGTGRNIFHLKNIGIEEDYNFIGLTWEGHLKHINKQFDKIKTL